MSDTDVRKESTPRWKFWKRRRYMVAILAFFGYINVYTVRANLSVAIVAMTSIKNETVNNETISKQEFQWDSATQGYVLGSFFYGYATTQFLGGWLAARWGGKWVLGLGVLIPGVLTLLTPEFAKIHVYCLILVRTLVGVFGGVTYPCIHGVWSRWAPPLERTRMATFAYSGSYTGTVITMPLSAYLATNFGWPSIFYFFGAMAIFWFIFWTIFVYDSPSDDPRISQEELEFIQHSLGNIKAKRNIKHPWSKIFTSFPVWALITSHFVDNWAFYFILTLLPKFMKDMFQYDLDASGFLTALPYLAMAFVMMTAGQVVDWIREKKILTTTQVRKVVNCGAFIVHAIFMQAAVFVHSAEVSIALLSIAAGLGVASWSGFGVNYLDVAPLHASVLMGITNTFGSCAGILSPILTGYVVTSHAREQWQIVFGVAVAFLVFGTVVYALCASGEKQPWAVDDPDE